MNKQIRNLGLFLMLCYLALFVRLNYLTIFEAEALKDRPENSRQAERDFDSARGTISSADGVVLAVSEPTNDPDAKYRLQRKYPLGDLFGHITGFFNPLSVGTAGLERQYNEQLAGRDLADLDLDTLDRFFEDFFVDKEHVGNLTLTMRADVQTVARETLGAQRGSVVALDPRTGGILALWSYPSYDPNLLAVHSRPDAIATSQALLDDPNDPRLARAYQERFPPGSTFKVVTATGGLENGSVTEESPEYPSVDEYTARGSGSPIRNFDGATCGGTLILILEKSCNTAFAQMGVDQAGPADMINAAEGYGFNRDVPIDLPRPATSHFPNDKARDPGFLAQIAIGQNEVAATPLQMAMVAAAIANDGKVMRPHVLAEIRDEDEEVVRTYNEEVWSNPMSSSTASTIRNAMESVVANGTAKQLDNGLEDFVVGGKTGTAQFGETGRSHAWIIGFAGPPGEPPQVAVAVIVEQQEGVSEQTGGKVAAPIAAEVLRAALTPTPPADESASSALRRNS